MLYSIEASDNSRRDYHYDEMGNTLFLSDSSGSVIASYAYSPYGMLLAKTGTVSNTFTWQGQFGVMQDGTTGLYYMRARYYESATGRFISRDPIKSLSPRSINPYQYAWGNSMRLHRSDGIVLASGKGRRRYPKRTPTAVLTISQDTTTMKN